MCYKTNIVAFLLQLKGFKKNAMAKNRTILKRIYFNRNINCSKIYYYLKLFTEKIQNSEASCYIDQEN